jgi:hypothetical protein
MRRLRERKILETVAAFIGVGRLEKCYAEHSFWMAWLKADPVFNLLRKEAGVRDLLSRLKFPE